MLVYCFNEKYLSIKNILKYLVKLNIYKNRKIMSNTLTFMNIEMVSTIYKQSQSPQTIEIHNFVDTNKPLQGEPLQGGSST